MRKLILLIFCASIMVFCGICIYAGAVPPFLTNAELENLLDTQGHGWANSASGGSVSNSGGNSATGSASNSGSTSGSNFGSGNPSSTGSNSATGNASSPGSTSASATAFPLPDTILEYSGQDVVELNDNLPNFTESDIENITGESFSELDDLGRCGRAVAMLHRSMLPDGERGSIREIRPSGWNQEKYPGLVDSDPPYLWNRCHLIAYGLTGQNANERNLITGTRYMNATTMLPYEEEVIGYLHYTKNHVLYRVTPRFKGAELVARGVEMEAYSVEDRGAGICFHVFVYNVQPGIMIDYADGSSRIE